MKPNFYIVVAIVLIFGNNLFAQIPSNDNCNSAIPLTVGSSCNFVQYTNANATASVGVPAPGCGNYAGGDVWFSAVVPANGSIIFDANTGVITDGAMALYSGTCAALTLIACDDDGSANGLMPSISATGLTPGTTVYLRFWEYGNNNNGTFSLCARSFSCSTVNNASCNNADPFCTGVSYDYCNTTNVASIGQGTFPAGTNYNTAFGCLGSSPNPAFYYFNVATGGSIDFNISQQTNTGVPIDVDFIMWGPFASQGAMCSGISAGNILDCSYSAAAVETANIPNAIAGQWYLVLITNFSNQAGVINFTQTNSGLPGSGTTNCNILTAQPSACSGGLYTLNGILQVTAPPASGTLTIANSCGGSQVFNAQFSSSIPYSIPNLCGNGQSCSVTATFSAGGAPTILPATYTAPSCPILTATPGACVGGQYVMSGTLTVGASCLPSSGTLTISSSCGGSVVIDAPFAATQNWQFPPASGNGGNCTITAVYSAPGAPVINPVVVTEPQCNNGCVVNAGTVTTTATNGTVTVNGNSTQIILCPGGSFNLVSNNNYILPPSYDPGFDDSELFYAIYAAPGPTVTDPDLDPNWTGYYWTAQNITVANSGGFSSNSSGGCSPLFSLSPVPGFANTSPTNNTFIWVPITADDGDNGLDFNGIVNHDQNNDGCFDIGDPISITYLNPITFSPTYNCNGSVSIEINGGYPQYFTGLYTITNTGAGVLSANQVTSGGNLTISGLTSGQTISFSVNDGFSCAPATFTGTYNGPPTVSISPSSSSICAGCVNLNATVTSGVSATSRTFSTCAKLAIPDAGVTSNNTNSPSPPTGNWAQSCISVSGMCNSVWTTGEVISVNLNISHTWASDLEIWLQAPNGTYYLLSSDNGGSGDNYSNITFSAAAATNITVNTTNIPANGTFRPEGNNFSGLNNTNINGNWCLWINDDELGDVGSLLNWSITFANENTYTYAWTPTAGLSNTSILNPQACPSGTTTYSLTVTNSCGCSTTANSTITVTAANTAGTPSTSPSLCVNTALSPEITIATTGATGIGAPTGLPAGVTATWAANTITISGTPTASGTFNYSIPLTGGCGTLSATGTITVNPIVTPTFTYSNQTLCQNAIITLPILNQTSTNGIVGVWNPVSINTSVVGPTTYTFTPNAGQCATSYQFTLTIVPESNAGTGTTLNLCSSATPINLFNSLGGTPQITGVWTGPSALSNGYLGTFDPATQLAGPYTYTVSGTNPCPNAVATITINLSTNPSASFLYPGAPFCINQAGSISPVLNGTAGGSYTASPAGLSISPSGAITPSGSTPGTYTVIYSIPANGSCPAFATQNTVTIIAPPGVPTLTPNPICEGSSITLTGGNAAWYEFTINGVQVQAPSSDNTYVAATLAAGDQVCVIGHPLPPFAFNGQITEAEWGSPLAISTGGPVSGFGAGNNLDAIYLKNTSGYLFGALAGQTQNNSNNRILLFIDCEAGGYNSLAGWTNRTNAPYYSVENLSSSIQFDAGFEPDYILAMNQASAIGYFDLYRMSSNINVFIGQTGVNPLLGYQNNGGQGILNAGYEFGIPLSNLNNPTGSIKVFAMLVNDPGAGPPTFISNQFLTPAGAGESNYGSGAINFGLALPNPISYSLAAACTSQTCITVSPTPVASAAANPPLCSGQSTSIALNSNLVGTTFTWTANPTGVTGASNGNGTTINQTLTTTTGGTVNYTITPSLGGCQGTPFNTSVTVSPTPTLTPIFHE